MLTRNFYKLRFILNYVVQVIGVAMTILISLFATWSLQNTVEKTAISTVRQKRGENARAPQTDFTSSL